MEALHSGSGTLHASACSVRAVGNETLLQGGAQPVLTQINDTRIVIGGGSTVRAHAICSSQRSLAHAVCPVVLPGSRAVVARSVFAVVAGGSEVASEVEVAADLASVALGISLAAWPRSPTARAASGIEVESTLLLAAARTRVSALCTAGQLVLLGATAEGQPMRLTNVTTYLGPNATAKSECSRTCQSVAVLGVTASDSVSAVSNVVLYLCGERVHGVAD